MFITLLQVLFVLTLIVVIILFVFQPKRAEGFVLPPNYAEILHDYVPFYAGLDEAEKKQFEARLQKFLTAVKITGANAEVEDLDVLLIGAAAIIPVFYIRDWEYINLREILLYPGHFNTDFDQGGTDRTTAGMVGTGHLQNVMILSKWDLRQGFVNRRDSRNTAIHEFVHLVDKMDGTLDGIPEILLERKYVPQLAALLQQTMNEIREGRSDIDHYGATSPVECFAVVAEYYFTQPEIFSQRHPELHTILHRIFGKR
ncbi:MAG TPA: M90 family metallopeptidase [Flavisolibacter sp.]|nr:M90 family metallopeptidase [Flavisolibacter sp.]